MESFPNSKQNVEINPVTSTYIQDSQQTADLNASSGAADQAAGRSQQIYETLVNSIDGIVWEADARTFQFTFVSPQAERLLGYPVQQWLEPNFWLEHVYPVDREQAVNTCLAATRAGRNHEFEYRMVAQDGRLVWIKDVASVILKDDQPVALRGIMLDVTGQKQTEKALQDQQIQLQMALEVAHLSTWDWNLATNVVHYSRNVSALLGTPPEANPSSYETFAEAVHPDDRSIIRQGMRRSLRTNEPYSIQFRVLWQDGSQHWISSRGRLLRDDQGKPARMVSVMMDITEQKQSEEALHQSRNFLQTVLDNLPVAVTVKDGRQEHFGQYTFWNKTCEQVFGLTADQAVGKTVRACLPEEQAAIFDQKDREIFERGVVEDVIEIPFPHQGMDDRLLHTVKIPIFDEQNCPQYLLSISEDITERRRVEESLRQQAEREALIAAITNDIRQSLDLKQILNTTVAEVRRFLQTDRVLILRFRPSRSGAVLVESVGAEWQSINERVFHDPCFSESYADLDREGQIRAIADTATEPLPDCYLNLLQELQVRASLTVPIQQQGELWGLLIAHHCSDARHWQAFEVDLLQQLAGQVGIAIEQSELYQQVQRLNADLERQVQIRTAELQLASEFEATLKRITDRVRDSIDEDQILQTAVRELATAIGVTGCNAAIYDLEQRTSKVSYEYTDFLVPLQGRIVQMDNFAEGYQQLIRGQHFQFCSLVPNPLRGLVAMLACPIFDDQGVLGDLWLVSHQHRAYNEQDIRLVQQVANQCAIAIRQARLYQKAQAQVKELEKLNHLKDDFLSTVSHELRTPMSNIKMATQMLELLLFRNKDESTNISPPPPASAQKAVRYFQILKDECQREINLINDLLDLSRLETGEDVLALERLNLNIWLPQLVQPFIERARDQQQVFELAVPTELPIITTDSSRLARILSELLNNACKYTPAGETISITVTSSSTHSSTPLLSISIRNSGVEISTEELTRIFDKFYRIPNNDPWKHGGTGLGLALVKKLLEPLNGSIQASSENGSTSFVVQLPTLKGNKNLTSGDAADPRPV